MPARALVCGYVHVRMWAWAYGHMDMRAWAYGMCEWACAHTAEEEALEWPTEAVAVLHELLGRRSEAVGGAAAGEAAV